MKCNSDRAFRILVLLGLLLPVLPGCSTDRAARIDAVFTATQDLNPDTDGQPSPVVVRMFHLGSSVAFNNASFFSLYDSPEVELGDDLKGKEEIEMVPGQQIVVARDLKPETRYLGVIAGYWDIEHATWRAVTEVKEGETLELEVGFSRDEVTIAPVD